MQLFAFNHRQQLIPAIHAKKQCDYRCLECGKMVRLRGGHHRQKHFYHVQANHACSLHHKSMEHLQIQTYLYSLLSPADCILERPFPEVSRIADVVWLSQKLIFEVQCSPITQEEVQKRSQDYRKCGYEIVWILHDRTFNRWRLCGAEVFLQAHTHYFTNIDKEGKGIIYDCFAWIEGGIRQQKMSPVEVKLNFPTICPPIEKKLPQFLKRRLATWKLHFQGDLIDRFFNQDAAPFAPLYFREIVQIEEAKEGKRLTWSQLFKYAFAQWVARPYRLVFQLFLEKYSN
ncbi:competence protein CoiA family protein [Parachlamydia sp. AcF125]|uniref:competence protein CoiA n=1 Tax=Parachlamydia sp. AcF125 TaxID=2795736 RepID=UPI001BCA3339|nr:competence protein CoiA family protein [Parachlamydia sp. AcF125]MBS4167543.1 hypothetical protein [Parachlamydia sp. AcF125]